MITLDLSILNQKGTPMFNSDLFANRPAAGIVGRIFISTDTQTIFRDTGTTWDTIGGGGGTIAGTIAAGQVAFGTAANTIGGNNNLFWDNAQIRLGIGTNAARNIIDVVRSQNSATGVIIDNPLNNTAAESGLALLSNTAAGSFNIIKYSSTHNQYKTNLANDGIIYNGIAGDISLLNDVNTGRIKFAAGASNTANVTLFSTGNLVLNQTTDAGIRLFVNGGIGLTNFQSISSGNNAITFESFRMIFATSANTLNAQSAYNFTDGGGAATLTAGATGRMSIGAVFSPTSGTATYTNTTISTGINQTGGANGITRALHIINTLTSAADFRSIEWNNNTGWGLYGVGTAPSYFAGNVQIGSTTPIAANIRLQVTGTGQINDTRTYVSGTAISFATVKDLTINSAISGSSGIINNANTGLNIIGASISVPSSTTFANLFAYNQYQFSSAGLTLTATQPGTTGIRTISQITTQNVFTGTNSGTITHVSSLQLNGFYNNNTGTSTPVITNAYQLLINDTGEFAHTFSFTNRWAIYQPGINDRNYLAGNLLLNSTTDTGQILQVNGAIRVNGQASATAGGSSGNHLIINLDGTQYKIALLNP